MKQRNPKFTKIEQDIINDGVHHGVTRALAVKAVRNAEESGVDADTLARQIADREVNDPQNTLQAYQSKSSDEKTQSVDDQLAALFGQPVEA